MILKENLQTQNSTNLFNGKIIKGYIHSRHYTRIYGFSNVWTDVNGPSKFLKCESPLKNETTDWKEICHVNGTHLIEPPPQLFYDAPVFGKLYANETIEEISHYDENGAMTNTNKYACEYFYYLLEKEESDFTLKNSDRKIRYLRDNVMECFAEATLEFLDEYQKGLKCYERRSRCLKHRGWCYAGRNREF